jgi:hypothetical protein
VEGALELGEDVDVDMNMGIVIHGAVQASVHGMKLLRNTLTQHWHQQQLNRTKVLPPKQLVPYLLVQYLLLSNVRMD